MCSDCNPLSNSVNECIWFMVCSWPHSQMAGLARPHLCTFTRHAPWPDRNQFSKDHVRRTMPKRGCHTVGPVTNVCDTEADNQSFLHCTTVSTSVTSVSRCHVWRYWTLWCKSQWRVVKTVAYTGQFWWTWMLSNMLLVPVYGIEKGLCWQASATMRLWWCREYETRQLALIFPTS